MKKIWKNKWVQVSVALLMLILAGGWFTYKSFSLIGIDSADSYTLSQGFIAGTVFGIIINPVVKKIREKKKSRKIWKNKWVQVSITSLVVILLGAWSFNDSVVVRNGSLWIFTQGYLAGSILTAMIYIILDTLKRKNHNSKKKIREME